MSKEKRKLFLEKISNVIIERSKFSNNHFDITAATVLENLFCCYVKENEGQISYEKYSQMFTEGSLEYICGGDIAIYHFFIYYAAFPDKENRLEKFLNCLQDKVIEKFDEYLSLYCTTNGLFHFN